MKKFLSDNKVVLVSVLSAVALVLQQAMGSGHIDWKAIGYACVVAALGKIANAWKGKGITILGIIGTVSYAFTNVATGGVFTWNQFILSSAIALIAAFVSTQQITNTPTA